MEYFGVAVLAGASKLLKTWSGRRGSNPRPTAWKFTRVLKIKNICADGAEFWLFKPLSFLLCSVPPTLME